jgi:signal transduction histidine kinase
VAALSSLRGIPSGVAQGDRGGPLTDPTTLDRLVARLAHEINNPLTYVMANLEVLQDRLHAEREISMEEMHDLVADSLEGADRIRRVIQQLQRVGREGVDDGGPVAG